MLRTIQKNKKIIKNNTKIDSVYWINMDKSTDRKKHMIKELKDPLFSGMKKYRVKGVDGDKKDIIPYLNSKIENINLNKYPPNIYACLLSHLNTILKFSKSNNNNAIIFEDDMSLEYKKYWKEDLNSCIQNAPKDWEILQVSIFLYSKDTDLPNDMYTSSKTKLFRSCTAYIINKKGALQFLKNNYKNNKFILDKNIEHAADEYIYLKTKTYAYKYPYFTYTGKDSTLHSDHVKLIHIPIKQKIEKLLHNSRQL